MTERAHCREKKHYTPPAKSKEKAPRQAAEQAVAKQEASVVPVPMAPASATLPELTERLSRLRELEFTFALNDHSGNDGFACTNIIA